MIPKTKPQSSIYLICALVAISLSSCFLHYYQTNSTDQIDAATVQKLMNANKYFILHANNTAYALAHVKVNDEILEGDLDSLDEEHSKYLHPLRANHNRFPVKYVDTVLYEVHLYALASETYSSHISIPLKQFSRMDIYELDKKSTNKSKVASIIGVTLTTAGVAAIIIAAASYHPYTYNSTPTTTGSSDIETCSPQVYVQGDDKPELKGTLYSGAIYASLQRTDYLPLTKINPANNKLRMMVKGERNEEIMITDIKLLQVTHSVAQDVLIDRKGNVLVYAKPAVPEHAFVDNKKDIREDLIARDEKYYSFTNNTNGENSSDILLDFRKPRGAASGKLIIRAANSPWSFYLFRQFKSLYGDYYNTMVQKKDKADPKLVLQCELDQSLPLVVSVKHNGTWEFVDYFLTPGNAAPRDLIMQLDLADLKDEDYLQIRLQTTYMFWNLDYAGMDFSAINPYKTSYLQASGLFKTGDDPGKNNLANTGNPYLHINSSEQLNLEFNISPSPGEGLKNSYFLMGNGYYHDNSQFNGKPQLNELSRFSGKGAFDKFSREKFEGLLKAINDGRNKDLYTAK